MGMTYFDYMTDIFRSTLKKYPEISVRTRNKVVKELDMEMLRNGLFQFDIGAAIFFYLAYISDGDLDKIKVPLAGRSLLQPDFEIDISNLSKKQIETILWTAVSFLKKMNYYEQFKTTLGSFDNNIIGKNNPFIPF